MDLSDDDRRLIKRRLALIALFGPLTVFAPRLAAAVVSPQRYIDSWQHMTAGLLTSSGWLLLAWMALPYLVVGYLGLTYLHLTRDPTARRRRRWALMASLAGVFALGAILNVPQTFAGVNFGVVFFPFYAAPFAIAGYVAGYLAAHFVGGPVTSGAPPH